jgi:predicted metal-dependent enzyme (double-stranded beta helix superfamily)
MAVTPQSAKVGELIQRLDVAVTEKDDAARCRAVKRVLEDIVASGEQFIDPPYLAPHPDRYARRLLHRDPQGRYTAIVMVWDQAQGTQLHEHAGIWCVEVVYRGRIQVTSYSVTGGDPERDLVQFRREMTVMAGVGEAGALIPPFEYHVLENKDATPAITIHVYGGEMTYCHIFEPSDGGYLRKYKELAYTA